MSTASREDYIKEIFNKSLETGKPVTTSFIAEKLCVSNAAITDMLKKLKNEGLVKYERYKGVALTETGKKTAMKVLRRHRLWELFLIEALGLEWDEVHDEAERLEHETSEKVIDKIEAYLNFPKIDPHGAPIPDKNGVLPTVENAIPLADAAVGGDYTVLRVKDNNNELVQYLSSIGLLLNSEFRITEKRSFDDSISIAIGKSVVNLTPLVCKNVFVKPTGDAQ